MSKQPPIRECEGDTVDGTIAKLEEIATGGSQPIVYLHEVDHPVLLCSSWHECKRLFGLLCLGAALLILAQR